MAEIYGLEIEDIPDGAVPMEAVVLVHGLDEDGDGVVFTRSTDGLTTHLATGMLLGALDKARDEMLSTFQSDDD